MFLASSLHLRRPSPDYRPREAGKQRRFTQPRYQLRALRYPHLDRSSSMSRLAGRSCRLTFLLFLASRRGHTGKAQIADSDKLAKSLRGLVRQRSLPARIAPYRRSPGVEAPTRR